jgi:hypothetical protein
VVENGDPEIGLRTPELPFMANASINPEKLPPAFPLLKLWLVSDI